MRWTRLFFDGIGVHHTEDVERREGDVKCSTTYNAGARYSGTLKQ